MSSTFRIYPFVRGHFLSLQHIANPLDDWISCECRMLCIALLMPNWVNRRAKASVRFVAYFCVLVDEKIFCSDSFVNQVKATYNPSIELMMWRRQKKMKEYPGHLITNSIYFTLSSCHWFDHEARKKIIISLLWIMDCQLQQRKTGKSEREWKRVKLRKK